MRVFKNAWFVRFARKERISDAELCEAVARAERGLIDDDLGGGVLKQRVARSGAGRSGGYRTLVFFRFGARAVFAHGYAKNDRANIDPDEERDFKKVARMVQAFSNAEMDRLVSMNEFEEVFCDVKDPIP